MFTGDFRQDRITKRATGREIIASGFVKCNACRAAQRRCNAATHVKCPPVSVRNTTFVPACHIVALVFSRAHRSDVKSDRKETVDPPKFHAVGRAGKAADGKAAAARKLGDFSTRNSGSRGRAQPTKRDGDSFAATAENAGNFDPLPRKTRSRE